MRSTGSMNVNWRPEHFDYVKVLVSILLVSIVITRHTQDNNSGTEYCQSMFTEGAVGANNVWSPLDCMTYHYRSESVLACARKPSRDNLFFLGDSDLTPLFDQFTSFTSTDGTAWTKSNQSGKTVNPTNSSNRTLTLCFFHRKRLNNDVLSLLEYWTQRSAPGTDFLDIPASETAKEHCMTILPSLIIVSFGKDEELEIADALVDKSYFEDFYKEVAKLARQSLNVPIIWMLQSPMSNNTKQTKKLNEFNSLIINSLSNVPNLYLMSVNVRIAQEYDGIVCSNRVCSRDSPVRSGQIANRSTFEVMQLIWNFHCNEPMGIKSVTCCRSPEPLTPSQFRLFLLIGICFIATLFCFLWEKYSFCRAQGQKQNHNANELKDEPCCLQVGKGFDKPPIERPSTQDHAEKVTPWSGVPTSFFAQFYELVFLLTKLGIILVYFYICDRTNVFAKRNKLVTPVGFGVSLLCMLFVGLLSVRTSKHTQFNHADITREWKGWMQIYILIYHYFSRYPILGPYLSARFMVSAYLFLSGYGHTCYFWRQWTQKTENQSNSTCEWTIELWALCKRYMDVMYRMNFFVVCLCFMMNREYMFYYFVPLISFWFTVVFVTLQLFPHSPRSSLNGARCIDIPGFIATLSIIFLLLAVTEFLYNSTSIFAGIFLTSPLRKFFATASSHSPAITNLTDISKDPWFFRWSLDRHTTVLGVFFTICFKWFQQRRPTSSHVAVLPNTSPAATLTQDNNVVFSIQEVLATTLGFIILSATAVYVCLCRDRTFSVLAHPYLCVFPILGYMSIRNGFPLIRTHYSVFFAWCGDISLELFLAQYHIWMGHDSYGILYLFPSQPIINITLTTIALVCVAHEVHSLTAKLHSYVVPNSPSNLLYKVIMLTGIYLFLTAKNY